MDLLDLVADLDAERVEIVPVDVVDGVMTVEIAAAAVAGGSAIVESGGSVGGISSICTSGMGDAVVVVAVVSVADAAGVLEARVRPRDSSGVPVRAGSLDCQKEGIVP